MGHCESYSYGLELETALAKAIEESNTYLTPQIVTGEHNIVFHSEWDNLNKIKTNVTGSNVVSSAAGDHASGMLTWIHPTTKDNTA